MESIIGSEIYSNPTQHVRIKPPEHLTPKNPDTGLVQLGATPWHQDSGVVTAEADESEILNVWIPVWDADEAAGCLHLVPRSHREGLKVHCPGGTATSPSTLGIPDELFRVGDAVPVPMRRGSALFMHRLTCHGSLPNRSDRIRWSLDLRYNPTGQHTGRPVFPGFVARSRRNPESELDDSAVWAGLWRQTRARLAGRADPSLQPLVGQSPGLRLSEQGGPSQAPGAEAPRAEVIRVGRFSAANDLTVAAAGGRGRPILGIGGPNRT